MYACAHFLCSEPLKAVPVKLPIADGLAPNRQSVRHQHNIAHGIQLDKTGTSDFNTKVRMSYLFPPVGIQNWLHKLCPIDLYSQTFTLGVNHNEIFD